MGRPAGAVSVVPAGEPAVGRAIRVDISRGSALGLPFLAEGGAQRAAAVAAYAHACACIAGDFDAE
eukprot:761027-Pleurochrysis_carterae.AAC.1